MIGRITTELACAVTGTPYERANQYLKRGQLVLTMEEATSGKRSREWVVMDVVKLAVLRELTDLGVSIRLAAEWVADEQTAHVWQQFGCNASIAEPDAAPWFLVVARDTVSEEPGICVTNEAKSFVFGSALALRSAVVLFLTEIARDVRRKLEAIGTA